jgi:hypothetical protein
MARNIEAMTPTFAALRGPIAAIAVLLTCGKSIAQTTATVTVDVHREDGSPLPEAPIEVASGTETRFALADASGHASFQLIINDGNGDEIVARLWDGSRYNLDPDQVSVADARFAEYTSGYFLQNIYTLPIQVGQVAYNFTITGYPAVTARGTVTVPGPSHERHAMAWIRGGAWNGSLPFGEAIEIHGIRRGAPAEIFVKRDDPRTMSVRLTAVQTITDVNIGELSMPDYVVGTAQVDVTTQGGSNVWGPGSTPLWRSVTLIRTDGGTILTYLVNPADNKVVERLQTVQPRVSPHIPAGTYYVVPGTFGTGISLMVLDRIRAGTMEVLDAHSVPKVVAVDDQTATLTLDVVQARDAIVAAGGG